MDMNSERLKAQLRVDEDEREYLYDDDTGKRVETLPSGGKPTIGVGFNLGDNPISSYVIEILLDERIRIAVDDLDRNAKGWRDHSELRQEVLANMSFNMGWPKFKKFYKMWAALNTFPPDYVRAHDEMLDSRWARQVGSRAIRLANTMRDDA